MNRLSAKLVLMGCVWCELMAEFGFGAGSAFVLTLMLVGFSSFMIQVLGIAMRIAGPGVVSVAFHAVVWFILFWWMAPAWLWHLPWIADIAALGVLGLAGARCRQDRETAKAQGTRPRKDRSVAIFFLVIVGVIGGMLALHVWGSFLPLVGYALLPAIPFRVGWQWAPPVPPERADAKMGKRSTFEQAGWSAER